MKKSFTSFRSFKSFLFFILFAFFAFFAISGILLASFYPDSFSQNGNNELKQYNSTQINIGNVKKWDPRYKKYYEKIINRNYILTVKNSQLEEPLYLDDVSYCLTSTSFEEFRNLDDDPKKAFYRLLNHCSFHDFYQQIVDKKESEEKVKKLQILREKTHVSSQKLNATETLISSILNPKNWDSKTGTLLGNQQGIFHTLTNQGEDFEILGIKELIGVGLSTYYHSSNSRKVNLRNAASKLDGKIIHPGETLSVVQDFSPFNYNNGYVNGIIIKDGKDATEMGGGVCQSVTTIFRAWQNAGLEVTKFQPHSKSISYYGHIGFDATMYSSGNNWGNVDLLLKNNSENSILIKVIDRDPYQMILLYGTRDRKVLLDRYYFGKYSASQLAKWKRSIEYNNSGEWIDNYFQENQKYY